MTEKLRYKDFYQSLPEEVLKDCDRLKINVNSNENVIDEIVPKNSIRKIKSLDFDKSKKKYKALIIDDVNRDFKTSKSLSKIKLDKCKAKKKIITSRQRYNLFKLKGSTNFKYETFLEINKLWILYMKDLIKNSNKKNSNINLFNQLAKADYHGALFIVAASDNTLLVGIKGIVVKENKNVFYFINKSNKLLTIPKKGCIFAFQINGQIYKLNGNLIKMNSFQRTRAKFKSVKSMFSI